MNRGHDRYDDWDDGPLDDTPLSYLGAGDVIDMADEDTTEPGRGVEKRPHAAPVRTDIVVRWTGRLAHRATRSAGQAGAWAWSLVRHERTRVFLAFLVRNGAVYPLTGAWVLIVRWWEARTNARYERMLRATEAAGDRDGLGDWEQRGEQARERRHRRRMDWLDAPARIVRAVVIGTVALAGLLLGVGVLLAVSRDDLDQVLAPIRAVTDAIAWLVWLISVAWTPALLLAPWVGLVIFWHVGRSRGAVPAWVAPPGSPSHVDVIVTPGGIATALAHLGIPALNAAVKNGWQVEFSTPPVRISGRGYQAVFSLPMGVTPDMVANKRDVLARNLSRAPLEVWPAAAEAAGQVDLWVADQGSTGKPAPPYPLLHEGTADVFTGVPCGVSQRGDVIGPPLPGANVVFGGLMGQGKSNAARVLMAGAALDPIADLWVFVFANNGDFDAYAPRLARYHHGTDDTIVVAAVESLQELYDEVGRREARLAALGAKKVTRSLAEQHADLRPRVVLFSECHELFGHVEHGREAADLAVQTLRRARKTAITLVFDTQSSRADAIPPKIVELVQINSCFAVKTWRVNDGFLGDGSFQAGIRATELRPGKDVGTSVFTGATPERFEIVKWFYLDVDDDAGYDAAAEIIARAMTGLKSPSAEAAENSRDTAEEADRDLLSDLDAVLGPDPIPSADAPALLRELAPHWEPYRRLTGTRLRDRLVRQYGIKVPSTGNRFPLDPATVRRHLARREADERPVAAGGESGG